MSLRRHGDGGQWVVLSFPYDAHLVNLARSIPHRRFDWDTREWSAPVTDWAGIRVQDILERYPELEASDEVVAWLKVVKRRWIGNVSTIRHDGRGWWVLHTIAGPLPEGLSDSDLRGGRRPAAAGVDPSGGATCWPSSRRRVWMPAPSGRSSWSGPARSCRPRGWRGCAASRARSCAWRWSGIRTSAVAFEDLAASEGTRSVRA